jgi:hypothetical protein
MKDTLERRIVIKARETKEGDRTDSPACGGCRLWLIMFRSLLLCSREPSIHSGVIIMRAAGHTLENLGEFCLLL